MTETPDCTGGAACLSIHDTGDGKYLIVGAIAGGADVHNAGASVGFDEQAVAVPKAVIDAIGQPLRDRIAELEAQLAAYLDGEIPPYRGVAVTDMTDADRVRALRNMLETSIRLERRRRGRNGELVKRIAELEAERGQFHPYADWGVRYGVTPVGDEEYRETIAERASEGDARAWRDEYAYHGVIVTRTLLVGPWRDADPTAGGDDA